MNSVRFVHFSDPHIAVCYDGTKITRLHEKSNKTLTEQLISGVKHMRENCGEIDFYIISGDLVHEGTYSDYEYLYSLLEDITNGATIYVTPGNHDSRDFYGYRRLLENVSCETYDYEIFDEKSGLRIISIDSRGGPYGSGFIAPEQLAWLSECLNHENPVGSILMMHHTPHISGEIPYLNYQMQNSDTLYDVIKNSDIKAIFTGHTHRQFVSHLGEIPCYTTNSITFGINTTETHMSWDNITGYNICDFCGGNIEVNHISIIPPVIYREDIPYSELYNKDEI